MSEFWMLVGQARADAMKAGSAWPSGSATGAALADRLAQLPLDRIVEFDDCYQRAAAQAHQWSVCAAAFVIWDYISDDAFSDFKAGLVALGRGDFERTVTDPDVLAGHPMVQAIAAGQIDPFALGAEAVQFAASKAYEHRTADTDAFWEVLQTRHATNNSDDRTADERWSGQFGSAEDRHQIPLRLPRLHTLFASRASDQR